MIMKAGSDNFRASSVGHHEGASRPGHQVIVLSQLWDDEFYNSKGDQGSRSLQAGRRTGIIANRNTDALMTWPTRSIPAIYSGRFINEGTRRGAASPSACTSPVLLKAQRQVIGIINLNDYYNPPAQACAARSTQTL